MNSPVIKSEGERKTGRQKQKQLSQKMSEAEYMEGTIRKGDKELDLKNGKRGREKDKSGRHKSREERWRNGDGT